MAKASLSILGGLVLAAASLSAAPITVTDSSAFTLQFNGFGDGYATIDGLTSSLFLDNFSFSFNGTNTVVSFDYEVSNTSTAPMLTSRVSGFGFQTNPNVLDSALNSATGVYDSVTVGGNMPNGIGTVDVCITGNNCAGGGGAGVEQGNTGGGSISIVFAGSVSSFDIDNAYVRYQSTTCVSGDCPGSASGGLTDDGPPGGDIPEPSTYGLISLGLGALAMIGRRARNNN